MSRFPVVASDDDAWGTILNDFLAVGHNADGTLKNPASVVDVKADFGAKADVRTVTDASISSGTSALHSTSAAFTSADVGKYVQVVGAGTAFTSKGAWTTATAYSQFDTVTNGGFTYYASIAISAKTTFSPADGWAAPPAGAGGRTLMAQISSVSSGVATLNATATTTVSNTTCVFGTDDTAAFDSAQQAATAASGPGRVFVPGNSTYFVCDLYCLSNCVWEFGSGVVLKMPTFKTTDCSVIRLQSVTSSVSYLHDIYLYGNGCVIDMAELTQPASNTIARGIQSINLKDFVIDGFTGNGIPGTTGNIVVTNSNSHGLYTQRGRIWNIKNLNVRGDGSSCVQATAGVDISYKNLFCDGGVALRMEMDNWPATQENIDAEVIHATGTSGFPNSAVNLNPHSPNGTLRRVRVRNVKAEGGAHGTDFSAGTAGTTTSDIEVDGVYVTGGGCGRFISGNDASFPRCVHRNYYVTGSIDAGIFYGLNETFYDCTANASASYGFRDTLQNAGVVSGTSARFYNCKAYGNGTAGSFPYGFRNGYTSLAECHDCDFGDTVYVTTGSNLLTAGQIAATSGWRAGAGLASVSGSGGTLTVTTDGTANSGTSPSGLPPTNPTACTAGHYYRVTGHAALGTIPTGCLAQVTIWFYNSSNAFITSPNGNAAQTIDPSTGTTVTFSYQAPVGATQMVAVVKVLSSTFPSLFANGQTALWSALELIEVTGVAVQQYGIWTGTGAGVLADNCGLSTNAAGRVTGTGTVTEFQPGSIVR